MQLSGEITTEMEEEIRELYYKRSALYPVIYTLLGVVMMGMAVFLFLRVENSNGMLFGLFLLVAALVLLVYAFAMPRIAWRLYWPKFLSIFGRHLSCEVTSNGIKLKHDIDIIPWRNFIAIKQTETLVLIYLDNATAYPVHRSMAASPSDWNELISLLKKNIHRRIW
jgi:hypothetical protein